MDVEKPLIIHVPGLRMQLFTGVSSNREPAQPGIGADRIGGMLPVCR